MLDNLEAVAQAAGASLAQVVKLTLYLTDLNNFAFINELMQQRFASINDRPIAPEERLYFWPLGRRPDDHPGLSELGL